MDDLTISDPCVIFAMRRESMAFRREFKPTEPFPKAPFWAYFCGPSWLSVLAIHCGVGKHKIAQAMDWILQKPKFGVLTYCPKVILLAGFSGSLSDRLAVGDLVLAREIANPKGQCWKTTWPGDLPNNLQPPLTEGKILMCDRIVGKTSEKKSLATQFASLAVDMECALFAEKCSAANIPFGCIRAISDDVETEVSAKFISLLSGGNVSLWKIFAGLMKSPALFPQMMRLAKSTAKASENLGKALGELLTFTLSWSDELDA